MSQSPENSYEYLEEIMRENVAEIKNPKWVSVSQYKILDF